VFRPGQSEYSQILKEFSDKVLASNFSDPVYKVQAATYLIDAGYIDYGLNELEKIHKSDPRELPTLEFLAMANKMPPLAVPSSLVIQSPVTCTAL
jgi:hypothetical protein